jgi:MerR family transcriptional regulator, light-induced transcriptional regulator
MQDGYTRAAGQMFPQGAGGVASLASDVVARLVSGRAHATVRLREDLIDRFLTAVVSVDLTDFETLKPDLQRARITPILFADRYVPEIARRLGKAWEDDTMSFAEVTMGVSRLQAILRQIGSDWVADSYRGSHRRLATVLLIVPGGEQHTLGAFVLMGQLRRMGISVCLRISPTDGDLRALLGDRQFDAAMISVAAVEKFPAAITALRLLKALTAGKLRVALGGAALHKFDAPPEDVRFDILTNDLSLAIAQLGLVTQSAHSDA